MIRFKYHALLGWTLAGGAFSLYATTFIRSSWLGDDSYITFRVVDNLLNGYGPRWNVAERVQAYTNPLWMLLTTASVAATGEVFHTAHIQSWLVSLAAAVVACLAVGREPWRWALLLLVMACSRTYVDYSTSGLENPLSHLLLALLLWTYLRPVEQRRSWKVYLLFGLAMLNRMDSLAIYLPFIAAHFWESVTMEGQSRQSVLPRLRAEFVRLTLGLSPFLAWLGFSLVYYGSLVPNSALAKVNTGATSAQLYRAAWRCLTVSAVNDPVLVVVIVAGCLAAFSLPRREWVGVLATLAFGAYLFKVGGDHMVGRFFSSSILLNAVLLARAVKSPATAVILGLVILAIGLLNPLSPLTRLPNRQPPIQSNRHYMHDEWLNYAPGTSFWPSYRIAFDSSSFGRWQTLGKEWRQQAEFDRLQVAACIGFIGYYAGPGVFIVDPLALSDPFLSRLPMISLRDFPPGHCERLIPKGYFTSIRQNRPHLEDPELDLLLKDVWRVARGPLWSRERWRAIWRLNTRYYRPIMKRRALRRPYVEELAVAASPYQEPAAREEWWLEDGMANRLSPQGTDLLVSPEDAGRSVEISLQTGPLVKVEAYSGAEKRWELLVDKPMRNNNWGYQTFSFDLTWGGPEPLTHLRVVPLQEPNMSRFGHVRFCE